jgi:peptide/nickel transport system permease protein
MHISVMRDLKKSKSARAALYIFTVLLLVVIIAPFFIKDPGAFSKTIFSTPSIAHLLGTNDLGQDIFSRLIYGLRTSIFVSISAGLIATSLSVIVGVISGFTGGIVDEIIMRIIDAMLIIPSLVILILISAFIRPNLISLIILIALFRWQGGARIIRGQTFALKQKIHIYSARTFGAKKLYILRRHIIPDLGNIIMASFLQNARSAVFLEAGMAFIGISSLSSISLGTIMHNALEFYYLPVWLWWLLPSGIMLSLVLVSFTLLSNLIEKVVDPRLEDA